MKKDQDKLPGFLSGLPSRSYMLMMAAGLYLAYTGYQLCHGIMTGESSGIGFLIGGIAFVLIGAAMVIVGIYGISVNAKAEKEAEESEEPEESGEAAESEVLEESEDPGTSEGSEAGL